MGVNFSLIINNSYNLGVDWSFFKNLAKNKTVCYNNFSWMYQSLYEVSIVQTYDWWHLSSLADAIFVNRMGEIRLYSEEFQKLLVEELKEQDKNIIVNLIKNHVQVEVIAEVFGVEEQYIYDIVSRNNLQVINVEE